jgi:hypothetical protein
MHTVQNVVFPLIMKQISVDKHNGMTIQKKSWDTYEFTDIYLMYYIILDMQITVFTGLQDDCNLRHPPQIKHICQGKMCLSKSKMSPQR